ncbi:hypothetical protein [Marinomonas sp. CT5]|nr:hypothetical protein [Marinomonas sp. CT5]
MEYMDLEERIRRLECLLMRAKEDEKIFVVAYYQALIDELRGK